MPYIGNVSGFDDVDREQIKDGAVSDVKISDVDHSKVTGLAAEISTAVSGLVDASPASLDTLNELAAALGDDAAFSTTVTNSIATKATATDVYTKTAADALLAVKDTVANVALKAPLASPTFTGNFTSTGIDDNATTETLQIENYVLKMTNSSGAQFQAAKATNFGYSSSYKVLQLVTGASSESVSLNYDPIGNASGAFQGNGSEVLIQNGSSFMSPNAANNGYHTCLKMSDGIVTKPNQPSFNVKTNYAAHTNIVSGNNPNWTVNVHNTGNHFDFTNNWFLAPVDGVYFFNAHALFNTTGSYNWLVIYVNNVNKEICHSPDGDITSYFDLSVSVAIKLSANDQVRVGAHTSGSNGWYSSDSYNGFSGYLLG